MIDIVITIVIGIYKIYRSAISSIAITNLVLINN